MTVETNSVPMDSGDCHMMSSHAASNYLANPSVRFQAHPSRLDSTARNFSPLNGSRWFVRKLTFDL